MMVFEGQVNRTEACYRWIELCISYYDLGNCIFGSVLT